MTRAELERLIDAGDRRRAYALWKGYPEAEREAGAAAVTKFKAIVKGVRPFRLDIS